MMSFDVKALFTSVPIEPALVIIEKPLKEDQNLQSRTTMSIQHIMDLLGLCLRGTYFTFNGNFYEQVEGAAMGSPIRPNSGKPLEPYSHHQTPLYCGEGLLMTPLLS